MHGVLIVSIFLLWFLILFYFINLAAEFSSVLALVAAFMWFVVPVGIVIQSDIDNENKHPCAQYETQMHYDVVLKMMRPMKVCILRGEWEDDKE